MRKLIGVVAHAIKSHVLVVVWGLGIALPDFYIISSFFYKKSKQKEYLPLFGFSVTMPLARKVPDVRKEQIYVYTICGSSADANL